MVKIADDAGIETKKSLLAGLFQAWKECVEGAVYT